MKPQILCGSCVAGVPVRTVQQENAAAETDSLGDDLVAIIMHLTRAIEEIRQVATGETQVADDDTGGMEWIAKRIAAINVESAEKGA